MQGVNGSMDLISQQTQLVKWNHRFDPKADLSTGCKWDHAFDPTIDTPTVCKWDYGFDPKIHTYRM